MKKCLVLLSVLLLVTACTAPQKNYAIQATTTMAQANFLRMQYEDVASAVNRNLNTFSHQEQEELVKIDSTFKMILSKMDTIFDKTNPTMTLADANYLYVLTKDTYLKARKLVEAHIDEFTSADKMRLQMFDNDVKTLSNQIESLLHDPQNKDVTASLMLMGTLAGNALKIILPLVL